MIDQLPFFKASFRKDVRYCFSPVFKAVFVLMLVGIFFFSIGIFTTFFAEPTPVRKYDPGDDIHQYQFAEDPALDEDDDWGYYDYNGEHEPYYTDERLLLFDSSTEEAIAYSASFILTIEFLILIFHSIVFTQDQAKGAVRTWFHYPISVKGYILSKTLNILLFTIFLSGLIYGLSLLLSFMLGLGFLQMIGLVSVTMLVLFLNYLGYIALFSILSKMGFKGSLTDPAILFLIGNSILLFLTESVITTSYLFICELQNWTYEKPALTVLKYVSPFHFLGVFYDWAHYGDPFSVLDFLWIPPTLIIIVIGFIYLKDLYPDMFIRETA